MSKKSLKAKKRSVAEAKAAGASRKAVAEKKAAKAAKAKVTADKKTGKAMNAAAKKADAKVTSKRAAAKAKAAVADQKAKHTAVLRKLDPMAKEINVRIGKAQTFDKQSQDHRISAGTILKEAEDICKTAGIPWNPWFKKNIKFSATYCYELLADVKAADPRLAVEDRRTKEAKKHRGLRAKAKAAHSLVRTGQSAPTGAAKTDFTIADEYLAGLDEKTQLALAGSRAGNFGKVLVDGDRLKSLYARAEASGEGVTSEKALFAAFLMLKPQEKVQFVKKVADNIGYKVSSDFESVEKLTELGNFRRGKPRTIKPKVTAPARGRVQKVNA